MSANFFMISSKGASLTATDIGKKNQFLFFVLTKVHKKFANPKNSNVFLLSKKFILVTTSIMFIIQQKENIYMYIQSNLSTTATLGTPKKWQLYRVGRSLQVFQSKLVLKVAWPDLGWPLLTGGRYSEVAVNTGLTVYRYGY
jgi:hypothetical protein